MPATNPTIQGTPNTVQWGSGKAGDNAAGTAGTYATAIILSASRVKGASIREYLGNTGFTQIVIAHDFKDDLELEIIYQTDIAEPATNTKVNLCGTTDALVKETSTSWEQVGLRVQKIRCTKYPDVVVT